MLDLETKRGIRKRIWEVDCLSMDAAIAAAFDWQDLVNFMTSAGINSSQNDSPAWLEMQAQSRVHHHCHSENALSLRIETLLNQWYSGWIQQTAQYEPQDLMTLILNADFLQKKEMAGMTWALGSDPRTGLDCIRRKLHQRFQVVALRRLA
jgi:hypothetical protein